MPNPHEGIQTALDEARRQTDSLFALISPETLYERPIAERHRLIFYLGHFEAFDWNVLARRGLSEPSFHPEFDRLFERGIDPEPGCAPADTPGDWPRRDEVNAYRARTRSWIDTHVRELDPRALHLTIEHRHMHAETFAYMLHNLSYKDKLSPGSPVYRPRTAPVNPMVAVNGGEVTLGNARDRFGWDNEHLAHTVAVPDFRLSKFKISNGEYLNFVNAGGSPSNFWTFENGQWYQRGMFSSVPLPLDWPAWVTWRQASDYAAWRGLGLPSEAQFHRSAALSAPDPVRDNFDYNQWDPVAVDHGYEDAAGDKPVQLVGNGWEWTRDVFAPYPGFEPDPLYPAYSADFFDGQHYVLKGASPRTAAVLGRTSFRNWFRPEYPFMYAGFRLVEN